MKKHIILIITIISIIISIGVITAYLVDRQISQDDFTVGDVDVLVDVYFEKVNDQNQTVRIDQDLDYVASIVDGNSFTKIGVCKINISDPDDIQFIKNFRVDIKINSNVDTYFRIAPYEQLTLTYNVGDSTREVAITQNEYMPFNYDPAQKFYNNREVDGFLYYTEKVKRVNETTPMTITLIDDFIEDKPFNLYESRYSLQIGFIIEAVQAISGPQNNWGLNQTPWNTAW